MAQKQKHSGVFLHIVFVGHQDCSSRERFNQRIAVNLLTILSHRRSSVKWYDKAILLCFFCSDDSFNELRHLVMTAQAQNCCPDADCELPCQGIHIARIIFEPRRRLRSQDRHTTDTRDQGETRRERGDDHDVHRRHATYRKRLTGLRRNRLRRLEKTEAVRIAHDAAHFWV